MQRVIMATVLALATTTLAAEPKPCAAVTFALKDADLSGSLKTAAEKQDLETKVRDALVLNLAGHLPFLRLTADAGCPITLGIQLDVRNPTASFGEKGFYVFLEHPGGKEDPYYFRKLTRDEFAPITSIPAFVEDVRLSVVCPRGAQNCSDYDNLVFELLSKIRLSDKGDVAKEGGDLAWILPFTERAICLGKGSVVRVLYDHTVLSNRVEEETETKTTGPFNSPNRNLQDRIFCLPAAGEKPSLLAARDLQMTGVQVVKAEFANVCVTTSGDGPARVDF